MSQGAEKKKIIDNKNSPLKNEPRIMFNHIGMRRQKMAQLRAIHKEKEKNGEIVFNKMGHPVPTDKFKPFKI